MSVLTRIKETTTKLFNSSQGPVLLCDEFYLESSESILGRLRDNQNCILFTSSTLCSLPTFDTIHMEASLRSTSAITRFAEHWRQFSNNDLDFHCRPSHKFEGENIEIKVIKRLNAYPSRLLEYPNFIAQCASSIIQMAEKSKFLPILPVICFMSQPLRIMLFCTLKMLFPDHRCINKSSGLETEFGHLLQKEDTNPQDTNS